MNSSSPNSAGSAGLAPPTPPVELFIVLPDGSCIPATPERARILLKQARSKASKQRKAKARAKAAELQCAMEDRAAVRRLLIELADLGRALGKSPAILRARPVTKAPSRRTSDVRKPLSGGLSRPAFVIADASSWIVDARGERGVHYNQTYLGRNSPNFYPGAAREFWEYIARDEAVMRDADGEPIIFSNLGHDLDEIGTAWDLIEAATTRKNGKVQIRIIVAFDADASREEQVESLKLFCETVLKPLGLPYAAAPHEPSAEGDQRNAHGHIVTSFRPAELIAPYTLAFAREVRSELDGRDGVQMLRHLWAHTMSEAAERAGRNMRYTGLGYGARGLDAETGVHLGDRLTAMARRNEHVPAFERNRIKAERNRHRHLMRDLDSKIAALTRLRETVLKQQAAAARPRVDRRVLTAASVVVSPRTSRLAAECRPATMLAPPPVIKAAGQPMAARTVTPARVLQSRAPIAPAGTMAARSTMSPAITVTAKAKVVSAALFTAAPPVTLAAIVNGSPLMASAVPPLISGRVAVASPLLRSEPQANVATVALKGAVQVRAAATVPPPMADVDRLHHRRVLSPFASPRVVPRLTLTAALGPEPTPDPFVLMLDAIRLARESEARRRKRQTVEHGAHVTACAETRLAAPSMAVQAPPASHAPARRPQRDARWRMGQRDRSGPSLTIAALPERSWFEATPFATPEAAGGGRKTELIVRQADGTGPLAIAEPKPTLAPITSAGAAMPPNIASPLLATLRIADFYVWDDSDGVLAIMPGAASALGLRPDELASEAGQTALAALRQEQQLAFAGLVAAAVTRPLSFSKTDRRPWPGDLDPGLRSRLDRWGDDEGFQHDLFFRVEQPVAEAHRAHAAAERTVAESRRPGSADMATALFTPVEDGFGGWRSTPPPTFEPTDLGGARVRAFNLRTGAPTEQLLLLARLAGEKPTLIDRADDGRLMTLPGAPPITATLLAMWRHDDAIDTLVTRIVTDSRAAGRPVWPHRIETALRAQRSIRSTPPKPDLSLGPSR